MKKIIATMAALLLCAVLGAQGTMTAESASRIPSIRVMGEAVASVEPDMATLTFGIAQQAKTPMAAREAVTSAADRVISSIAALGVPKKQIRTGSFNIYPVYDDRPGKQNQIVGYRGSETITASLDDTSLVAQAVDAAVAAGANEIRRLDYGKKDERALRVDTLRRAVEAAAEKAAAIAGALGVKLGKAISVEEEGSSMRSPDAQPFLAKAIAASPQEAFAPGSMELSASVVAVFAIERAE